MIREGRFGTTEAISLTTIFLITKAFYINPGTVIMKTATASWYATLLSYLGSLAIFLLICRLLSRFEGYDLVDIFDIVVGKFFGKALSLIFCGYFLYYSGTNLREFVEMIKAYMLPYTPPSLIIFFFLWVVVVYSYIGLEGIARMAHLSFMLIMLGLLFILVLPYPQYDMDNLFPIGGYGIGNSLYYGVWRISAYTEVIYLAFIVKSVYGTKNIKKIATISLTYSGIIIASIIACSILAFEYPQGQENLSNLMQLSRIVYFNRFFQRIETIFVFIWILASFITVSLTFYLATSIFCKTFNISEHKPLLLPVSFLTFMISLLPENLSQIAENNILFLRQYSIFIVYLIPLLILLISIIRGKKGMTTNEQKV